MKIIRYPERDSWPEILRRPKAAAGASETGVRSIINSVRSGGDVAVRALARKFDAVEVNDLRVGEDEIAILANRVPSELRSAIHVAYKNIARFHASQIELSEAVETTSDVVCWRRSVAIERVGLYVPGGSAPLFSTVLMLAIPARLAGCSEIVICTPPQADGWINEVIAYTAALCGVNSVFRIGGAQAIAAMAYGTESIPAVDKIFGPGNSYVTRAKQLVSKDVAIDMPAGPSEVAVIADESCDPRFVAADLLAQAEHGPESQVLLITTSEEIVCKTLAEITAQLDALPRHRIAAKSLKNSKAIVVRDLQTAIDIANAYAGEHLILAVADCDAVADKIINAGSVFVGPLSCESAGDYASGTNHTLPTAGFARGMSGLSLDSFSKKITFQKLGANGLRILGGAIETMAAAEGLEAHRRAVSIRLEAINGVRS